jgi:hypothetical protein
LTVAAIVRGALAGAGTFGLVRVLGCGAPEAALAGALFMLNKSNPFRRTPGFSCAIMGGAIAIASRYYRDLADGSFGFRGRW